MSLLSNIRTKQVKMQTHPEPFALGRDDGQSGAIMVSKCMLGHRRERQRGWCPVERGIFEDGKEGADVENLFTT